MEKQEKISGSSWAGLSKRINIFVSRFFKRSVSRYDQHSGEHLTAEESAAEYLQRLFNLPVEKARKQLGSFGLASHAHTVRMKVWEFALIVIVGGKFSLGGF